ncbi:MAG: bifunctional DedA family/phosphatase PAP2 family protein [Oleiphilaceae bacterium]|nr:bifunctional DedA family/phosphatase PAP2 family protein [Oleiphilaceae bacterium]
MAELSGWLTNNPAWLAMALILIALTESLAVAGLIVPGVALLFMTALLAAQAGMPMINTLLWAALGAVIGDTLSFWLGQKFQGRLHSVWPFNRYPGILGRGEVFFRQHGGKSVFIGRFVGPLRPVIPLVAGAFHMSARRFLAFNLTSALAWAPVYVLPGFLVGSAMAEDVTLPPLFYTLLTISLLCLALVYALVMRIQWGLHSNSEPYQRLQKWMAGHPDTLEFWRSFTSQRPNQSGEFPLASATLALAATALFLIWSLLTLATGLLDPLDQQVSEFFLTLRHPLFDPPMLVLSLLGDPWLMLLTTLIAALVFWLRGYYAAALHVGLATATTIVVIWALKEGFAVNRPAVVSQPPGTAAYPSGHAAGITVICGLAASFIAREWPARKRWAIYLAFALPMVMVALSRIYLGVHWFTDVVGGLLLGLAICGFTRTSFSRYDRTALKTDTLTRVALFLWLTLVIAYIGLIWEWTLVRYAPVPG